MFTLVILISQVYYQLRVSDLYGYYYNGLNLEEYKSERCIPVKTTFFDGLYYEPVNVSRDGDVYRIFRVCALCGSLSRRYSRRIHAHSTFSGGGSYY